MVRKNLKNAYGVLPIGDMFRPMVRKNLKNASGVLPIEDIFRPMVRENLKECIRCSTHRGYVPVHGKRESKGMHSVFYP